jgi:hypothetical protein|tara:strand:- start:2570 stop:2809 length:240 start_codon:yes stop_codon:yes gene_type:complete
MKISELLAEANMQLQVLDDTDDETTLHDPITKIKTVVPKDPKKPGMIAKDPTGKLTLNTKTTGPVDRGIKPGDVVKVSQ